MLAMNAPESAHVSSLHYASRTALHDLRHGLCLLLVVAATTRLTAASATGKHAMAVTVHPLATEAAIEAMRSGGNAVDAAVAAGLTLGVVDGVNSGIGGGCFIVIRLADGTFAMIDGRETAPAGATRDMFVRDRKADTLLSQAGALAIAVPGALAAYAYAATNFGRLPLATHLNAAALLAQNGFNLSATYAKRLAASVDELAKFSASRAVFLKPDGSPYGAGDVLTQADLAASYRALAEHGTGWFYGGPFAAKTAQWMKTNGGLITVADFTDYQARPRQSVMTTYRDHQIVGFPPPSSGGVHVAQILNVLENFNLKRMGADSAEFIHVVAEAMKLAFADRAYWLGDPDFAPVPRGLVSKEYAAELARKINLKHVTPVPQPHTPPGGTNDLFGKHTTHFSTADDAGNWVACTATINTTFGAKVVIPGTGVVMNNEMDDFSIQPGVANYFGLVGSDANAVAPGKRPLSSMSPTIVLKDGQPVLSVGAAGGPTIISQTLLAIVYTIDFGMSLEEALAAPRFHQQWQPDQLRIERAVRDKVLRKLEKMGHRLNVLDSFGAAQAVAFDGKKQMFVGAPDPRGEGKAAGF
jgi:gamma-glutamyltranspeptidase/glutathione hydrolase